MSGALAPGKTAGIMDGSSSDLGYLPRAQATQLTLLTMCRIGPSFFLPLAFASVEFRWPRHYRFSLRSMLIATTAIAIISGLILAFSR
jgi:hypothetical protein